VPLFDVDNKTTYPGEIDIIITKDTLITAHDKDIYQLTNFFKSLKEDKAKKEKYMSESPGMLLHAIMEMLLDSCFPKLDHISEKLNHVEEEIFAGNEKEMLVEISVVKRDILSFRRTMKPQKTVFESLAIKNFKLIEAGLKPYYQDLVGTNIRVWNALESAKETVESLEDTNNSLLSNKLNLTMKVLTIFSAILLPMTVYSNILAMSADIPFGKNPHGFWIHMGILAIIAGFTMMMFKIKKWL
jgi:magnesium transporter